MGVTSSSCVRLHSVCPKDSLTSLPCTLLRLAVEWYGNGNGTRVSQVDDDWTTILWNKVDYLASVGLAPWYTQVREHGMRHHHMAAALTQILTHHNRRTLSRSFELRNSNDSPEVESCK